ncbi:hypothetical protein CIHG_00116 [Coccidioides immitis H538.4]|uniref:Uncharacterized protein n=1 Tax=Coccidioides immitis H538.4 TaxID=396776 RepID=A0A0J8RCS7_COCIT|nr:hypothetical protein CIHG_00116 [Coccidioides immitis H538.4]
MEWIPRKKQPGREEFVGFGGHIIKSRPGVMTAIIVDGFKETLFRPWPTCTGSWAVSPSATNQGPMKRSQRKGLHRASAMGTRKNCYVPSSNDTNGRGNSDRDPCKPHGVKPHVVTTPTIIWRLASKEIAECSNTFERNWSANELPLIPAHPGLAR